MTAARARAAIASWTRRAAPLLATPLLATALLAASPLQARDWLDLRRAGPAAVLADARRGSAQLPWQAEYAAALPAGHPLAQARPAGGAPSELRLTVVRLPVAAAAPGKPPGLGRWMVRFDAPAALAGSGLVADGRALWIKLPGAKPQVATPALLAQPLAGLQLPLLLFALGELVGEYDYEFEGEFGDAGVIRCRPSYRASPGVIPGKLGVHKRWATWTLMEVTDRDGKRLAHGEWLDLEDRGGVAVPAALRLRPQSGDQAALTLARRSVVVGAGVAKDLSAKLLR